MKLHLPKMLFAAVVAVTSCLHQAGAETYYLDADKAVIDNNDGTYKISPAFVDGNGTLVSWKEFCSGQATNQANNPYHGPHQLVINEAWVRENAKVKLDFAPFNVTGFTVNYVEGEGTTDYHFLRTTSKDEIVIGSSSGEQQSSFLNDFTIEHQGNGSSADKGSIQLIGTQKWNIGDDNTVTLIGQVQNDGTTTINGGLISINKTLTNNGSLIFENGAALSVETLANFDSVYDVDYTRTTSGLLNELNRVYSIVSGSGTVSGLTSINYNGGSVSLAEDGTYTLVDSQSSLYYVANGDIVTIGGNSSTAEAATASRFAVAQGGTLKFADTHSAKSVFVKEVQGTGRVEVTLGSASNGGHGRGVSLGENFHGTLAVLAGLMDLSMFTLADDATLELQNGEHWTESNLTVNQNINVIGSSFSFRNAATTTLAGVVTAEYLNVGTTGNNHGTLKLSNAENDIQYVTVGCAGNQAKLVIAADMEFSKVVVNNSSSSITVDSGKTLTITGSDVEGDDVALSAEGKTVILNKGAKVNLGSDTKSSTSSIGTLTAHTEGNTITLASKATLNKIGTVSSGSVNLTGSGTYNLGAVAKNAAVTSLTADNSSVKLAQDWTGTVKLSGGEHQTGASQLDKCVQNINFNDLGRTGSTVEITSNGLYGYFVGSNQTFNPNIKLTGDLYIQNGSGGKKYTFAGQISGDGSMKITRTAGGTNDLNFTGDIQHWKGELDQSGDKTTNIGLSGSATEVNAAIKNTGSGTLNLTVDNSEQTTTFSKEVKVDKLTITDESTMTITATETSEGQRAVGDSKLSAKSIEFGKGAQLNVTGSITLDVSSISLKSGMTFTSASDVTLMTVTNGTLTVNNVDSWTGSTYEIDGRNYTTSLGVEDNTLQLKFTAEPLDSMDVYISLNGSSYDSNSDMLMLVMVDANGEIINDISRYYNVVGIHGEGSWDDVRELVSGDALVGLSLVGAGTPVVGDGASNVGFYGSYKGEGNGQYADKGQAIPEPATATLSLLALCGLAARRRRRA